MKKNKVITYSFLAFILSMSVFAGGCGLKPSESSEPPVVETPSAGSGAPGESGNDEGSKPDDNGGDSTDSDDEKDIKTIILDKADEIVKLIKERNYEELANHVGERKLLFSPYSFINEDALIFDKDVIKGFSEREDVMVWGTADGSGEPIEMTPNQYFDRYVYDKDYSNYTEKLYNENEQRGNTIKNINEKFPNAINVEYFIEGSEEYSGMDWSSLILVFEQGSGDEVKLIAIVHDQWTI